MINPTERTGNLIIIGVLFAIGIGSLIASRLMPAGQFGEMGPGFFPGVLGAILAGISLVLGGQTFLKRTIKTRVHIGHRDAWLIIGTTAMVAVMLKPIGFMPTIGLFIFFILKLLSSLGWIKAILISAVAAVIAYLFFDYLLGIPLPKGEWL